MKRWLIALIALLAGGGVSAALLLAANPSRGTVDVYAAARDLPAGSALASDTILLKRVNIEGGETSMFTHADEARLTEMRATHDLISGQLIQRGDVMGPTAIPDRRLVFVPVSGVPPMPAGARVDLLMIEGGADNTTVVPFALGVDVQASVSGGLVVAVPAREAAAFVFAAGTMHLAAVVAEPGAADGAELPISSVEQAMAVAAGR